MRDINRIDKITTILNKYWKQCPDLRLGQLLDSLKDSHNSNIDIFYVEDDDWEKWLSMTNSDMEEFNLKLQGFSDAYVSKKITEIYRKNKLDILIYNIEKKIEYNRIAGIYSMDYDFKIINSSEPTLSYKNDTILHEELKKIMEYFKDKNYDVVVTTNCNPTDLYDIYHMVISWFSINE